MEIWGLFISKLVFIKPLLLHLIAVLNKEEDFDNLFSAQI